ncbi:hypothetical protein H6P81_014346 [Aristolochia fimbriata]|uniref:Uncharacterized protein n=1 Tax=Aristolochia fimbriata TaxID=158543 RepID=A0AAV7ELU8_ARIFI|nr:hypothetical protein H6P81_014346 [Aristolochia fimbriata]
MEAQVVSASGLPLTVEKDVSPFSIYFGVSCAFVALRLLEEKRTDLIDGKWSIIKDKMLQGSAQLLGLLVWKAQRGEAEEERIKLLSQLKKAETEVAELRLRRTEDAKANEKVVAIFASQEQGWICERKRLRLQIQALFNELRNFDTRNKQTASDLNGKIKEMEEAIQSREKALEEEEKKRKELEEKVQIAEEVVEELRETMKKEAQEHSADLWKHKTAFIELVSNQRQLEAEMGRAVREVEATKQELDTVLEQKEEAATIVEKLSLEVVKLQKDAEQKDKILSAMLRKSKLDTSEKQILLKEIKICNTRKKQAELESERWRSRCEVRNENHLRGKSGNRGDLRSERLASEKKVFDAIEVGCSKNRSGVNPRALLLEFLEADQRKAIESLSPNEMDDALIQSSMKYSTDENVELAISTEVQQLEDWIRMETQKYASIIEQRHCSEIDAFAEQMRFKDEKIEVYRWRLLSMELESKRLQSHIEALEESVARFREENLKLEALLLDKEKELKTLKEKLASSSLRSRKNNGSHNPRFQSVDPMTLWSEVKIIKKKLKENGSDDPGTTLYLQDQQTALVLQGDDWSDQTTTLALPCGEFVGPSTERSCKQPFEEVERSGENCERRSEKLSLTMHASEEEIEEEKEVVVDPCDDPMENLSSSCHLEPKSDDKISSEGHFKKKDSPWKMDLQALGVSYKIKRLKQQLLLLERLTGSHAFTRPASNEETGYEPGICESGKTGSQGQQTKGVQLIISLLNKQVKRYQSLEEKTNDLCKRLENRRQDGCSDSNLVRSKKGTDSLENFLEETFQLQRYMVATGQKLTEIQSRISSNISGGLEGSEKCEGFDIRQFADNVRTLSREVQRGLEIRISRIIGDLEGTLACEGILHLRI